MALSNEILRLLRDEGYRINEAISDALDEFLALVEEENETIDEHLDDDEEDVDE